MEQNPSPSKQSNYYINGKWFTELAKRDALVGLCSDELVDMFYVLARKTFASIGRGYPRHSYLMIEEDNMVQEAVILCFTGLSSFDSEKGDAYNFFRSIIYRCYLALKKQAKTDKRNPGNAVFNIEYHRDVETDQRLSYLLMESQIEDERRGRKLCRTDVERIKRRLAEGETGADLAREYDVDPGTISKIKHGTLWSDI